MVAAWVPPGTSLQGKLISSAVVEGIQSEGMLASGEELGMNRDASGLLELNVEPGSRLEGVGCDWIIEIDNKSLTHRPDLWGHYGMAREGAAISKRPPTYPVSPTLVPSGVPEIKVDIEDYALSPRYSALVL